MVAVGVLVLAALTSATADRSGGAVTTPVMRPARVTASQIVDWFALRSPGGYRASVPVAQLAAHFLDEGAAQGVAGDIAFAQSVLETGWFRFATGSVRPEDNNFGGLGATGIEGEVASFPTARIGVRAQVQHLWAYADPAATADTTARPLVDPRFALVVPKGRAPTWEEMGGGDWAADPDYGRKVLALYTDLLDVSHVRVQRFVAAAFTDLLDRAPDATSSAWWTAATEARGRRWTARALVSTSEAVAAWIRDRYDQILHRRPTEAALAHRTATVRAGGSLADVVVALGASDEAWRAAGASDPAWVDALYRTLLRRPADAAAVAHWTGLLASGAVDRARVVRSVWGAAEGRRARTAALYADLLDRPADGSGLAWWSDHLTRIDDLDVAAELVASGEYLSLAQR
jgi:hypothetical protein